MVERSGSMKKNKADKARPLPKPAIESIHNFKNNLNKLLESQALQSKTAATLAERDKKMAQDLTIAKMMREVDHANKIQPTIKNILRMQLFALLMSIQKKKAQHAALEDEKFNQELDDEAEDEEELKKEEAEKAEALRLEEELQEARHELAIQVTASLATYFTEVSALMNQNMPLGDQNFKLFSEEDIAKLQQIMLTKLSFDNPSPEMEKGLADQIKNTLDTAFKNASERFAQIQNGPLGNAFKNTFNQITGQISKGVMEWLNTGTTPKLDEIQNIFRINKQREEGQRLSEQGSVKPTSQVSAPRSSTSASSPTPTPSVSSEDLNSAQGPTKNSPYRIPKPTDPPRPKGTTE